MTSPDILSRVAAGDRRALARALTLAENGGPQAIRPAPGRDGAGAGGQGRTRRIAVTGPPGAGKSTLVAALLGEIRARNLTVAVLAVDPSSPYTGGALLGDRIRMGRHALDDGVFIRSQASRGASGGLAPTTRALLDVLDVARFDVVLLETVGAGQADVDGVLATDFAVVVLAPNMGDSVQAMKAGLIEAADVIVVNKSDLGGADAVKNDLLAAFDLSARGPKEVLVCSARDGSGVGAVLDAALAVTDAELARRRAERNAGLKGARP